MSRRNVTLGERATGSLAAYAGRVSQPHRFRWLKGHGTHNDFVLLPDLDGSVHGDLDPAFVAALCHRRAGLGADGVLRVVRADAVGDPYAGKALDQGAVWFMDYLNADGSFSQMCGNGVRVFALHLAREGFVDTDTPLAVGTRDGVKAVTYDHDGLISVEMGVPTLLGETYVDIAGHRWSATGVDIGNPHAVAFVDDLDAADLCREPGYDHGVYPDGVNVELVVRRGPGHVAMRVHERGSGETCSCGTGACAVTAAVAALDRTGRPPTYLVDVPGGQLRVAWDGRSAAVLTGPAEIVADGEMTWLGDKSR